MNLNDGGIMFYYLILLVIKGIIYVYMSNLQNFGNGLPLRKGGEIQSVKGNVFSRPAKRPKGSQFPSFQKLNPPSDFQV